MSAGRLRVGVTIGLQHESESLWNNGIKQNAVFLAEALRRCPVVESVELVNTTAVPVTPSLPWDLQHWPTAAFDEASHRLDVVIELGGQLNHAQTAELHARGGKLVSYCCGFEYVHVMQASLFGRRLWGPDVFINRAYDAIWMIPQVADLNRGFFTVLRRKPAHVVPFVWDPLFLEQSATALPEGGRYIPRAGSRRLTVMEPNIDVVKFCLYPALIADEAYRVRPESIAILQVTNAEQMALHNHDFIALMNQLDLVREHKAVFLGRHATPQFLAQNTDIVISHQWENALNYFYLEVCWQGYPLVHNAYLCPDLGYYYAGNDVGAGRLAMLRVLDHHDDGHEEYRRRQRELIERYLPSNPELVARYDALLREVAQQPAN
jgi:hypothetical protein